MKIDGFVKPSLGKLGMLCGSCRKQVHSHSIMHLKHTYNFIQFQSKFKAKVTELIIS